MLRVLRENLKSLSWVLWLAMFGLIIVLFVDFGPGMSGPSANDAVARIDTREVTFSQLRSSYQRMEPIYRQVYGELLTPEFARQQGLQLQVLDGLIAEEILSLEAERMGLATTDQEVQDAVLREEVFKDELGQFVGADRYEEILRRNRLTPDGFEAGLRQQLLTEKLRSILRDNVYVSDAEVEEAYREQVERAKIEYLRVGSELFAAGVEANDAELQSYYDENREDFRLPERRAVHYMLVDREDVAQSLEIAEEELKAYYDANSADYTVEDQVRARHILLRKSGDRTVAEAQAELATVRARIEAGEDFATLAGEISEDPGSKTRGGDLGFFDRSAMVKPFADAAFSAQPGEIVGPVETSFGAHLIEVLERTSGGLQPFDEVRDAIRSRIGVERAAGVAETRAGELATRLRAEQVVSQEGMQQVADETPGARVLTVPAFGVDDNVPGIGARQPFATAAFELASGEISEPVEVSRGWAVLSVSEILAPEVPLLTSIEAQVRDLVVAQKRLAAAVEKVTEERARLVAGDALSDVAEELGVEVEESPLFGSSGPVGRLGSNPDLNRAALALDVDGIGGPIELDDAVVLFQVTERERFDPVEFAEAREGTRSRVSEQKATRVLNSLIERRRDELDIWIEPALLASSSEES